MTDPTTEEFDLFIGENDGMIYRHFPPEHPTCSPVFDPDGVDLEQDETELMAIFESMKAENTQLRLAVLAERERCRLIVLRYMPPAVFGGFSAQLQKSIAEEIGKDPSP